MGEVDHEGCGGHSDDLAFYFLLCDVKPYANYLSECFSNPVELGIILAPFQQWRN